MTTVVLFSSVLGIRAGERDAAARLEAAGYTVLLPDVLEGQVFDDYEPAIAHSDGLGLEELVGRALAAVDGFDLADGYVVAGFSQGSSLAVAVAVRRPVGGVLQLAGVTPVEWVAPGERWPSGVGTQVHRTLDDPFREGEEPLRSNETEVTAAGGVFTAYDYPGSGHLFTDPTRPDEYDAGTTELMWSRILPFLAGLASVSP